MIGRFNIKTDVQRDAALNQIKNLDMPENGITIVVTDLKNNRSLAQNRFLWSQVYGPIAQQVGEATDTLIKVEAIHEYMKSMFSPRVRYKFMDKLTYVPKSTTKFTKQEMSDYLEKVQAWAVSRGVFFDA